MYLIVGTVKMLTLLILASCLSTMSFADTHYKCPNKKNVKIHDKKCYEFVIEQEKSFSDAQKYCKSNGGNLALVKNTSTNKFIAKTLKYTYKFYFKPFWIGLQAKQKSYKWVDGTSLKQNHWRSDGLSRKGKSSCVVLYPISAEWANFKCRWFDKVDFRFVCEYPLVPVTPTTIKPTQRARTTVPDSEKLEPKCPRQVAGRLTVKMHGQKCYEFVINQEKKYWDAQKYCESRGGNLAVVESESTKKFIGNNLQWTYRMGTQWKLFWIYGSGSGNGKKCRALLMPIRKRVNVNCNGDFLYRAEQRFVCEYSGLPPTATTMTTTSTTPITATPKITSPKTTSPPTATTRSTAISTLTSLPPITPTTPTTTPTPATATTTITTSPEIKTSNSSSTPSTATTPATSTSLSTTTTTMPNTTTTLPNTTATTLSTPPTTPIITTVIPTTNRTTHSTTVTTTTTTTTTATTATTIPTNVTAISPSTTTIYHNTTVTEIQTTTMPLTTTERQAPSTSCPPLVCNLECSLDGYERNPVTHCMECKCPP